MLGFQELVELNPKQVLLGGDQSVVQNWIQLVLQCLNQGECSDEYIHLIGESLVGTHISVFAKKRLSHRFTDLATSKLKLGFSGNMGNKGATLVRFLYLDTSFCFINCHLESGMSEDLIKKRADQLTEVYISAFIKERGTQ